MPLLLVIAFIVVPIVELTVIGQVSDVLGGFLPWTLLLLIGDSLLGAFLVRREGRRAWQALRTAFSQGRWPGDEVAQGALVLVGGTLLLTPGFVTDAVGLLLVLPWSRAVFAAALRRRIPGLRVVDAAAARRTKTPGDGRIVDVEVVSVERNPPTDDDPVAGHGSSGGAGAPK